MANTRRLSPCCPCSCTAIAPASSRPGRLSCPPKQNCQIQRKSQTEARTKCSIVWPWAITRHSPSPPPGRLCPVLRSGSKRVSDVADAEPVVVSGRVARCIGYAASPLLLRLLLPLVGREDCAIDHELGSLLCLFPRTVLFVERGPSPLPPPAVPFPHQTLHVLPSLKLLRQSQEKPLAPARISTATIPSSPSPLPVLSCSCTRGSLSDSSSASPSPGPIIFDQAGQAKIYEFEGGQRHGKPPLPPRPARGMTKFLESDCCKVAHGNSHAWAQKTLGGSISPVGFV